MCRIDLLYTFGKFVISRRISAQICARVESKFLHAVFLFFIHRLSFEDNQIFHFIKGIKFLIFLRQRSIHLHTYINAGEEEQAKISFSRRIPRRNHVITLVKERTGFIQLIEMKRRLTNTDVFVWARNI